MRVLNVLALIGIGCCAPNASAGIVLSVDLDALTTGIQSSRTYAAGEMVQANFVLELTAATRISQYSFSVRFDTSELTFMTRTETPGTIAGWSEINPALVGSGPGLLFNFDAFGPTLVGAQGPFVIASATFTAQAPTGTTGELDIEVGPFNPTAGFDGFVDDGNPPMFVPNSEIMYRAASVNAVPEPSALIPSVIALLGCLLQRARRRPVYLHHISLVGAAA